LIVRGITNLILFLMVDYGEKTGDKKKSPLPARLAGGKDSMAKTSHRNLVLTRWLVHAISVNKPGDPILSLGLKFPIFRLSCFNCRLCLPHHRDNYDGELLPRLQVQSSMKQ
ncbi:hypothetical protein ACFL27_09745, partial [candidate division CSSED10-310 bacterium]